MKKNPRPWVSYALGLLTLILFHSSELMASNSRAEKTKNLQALTPIQLPVAETDESFKQLIDRINSQIEALKVADIEQLTILANEIPGSGQALTCRVEFNVDLSKAKKGIYRIVVRRADGWYYQLEIESANHTVSRYEEGKGSTDPNIAGKPAERVLLLQFSEKGFPTSLENLQGGKLMGRQATWSEDGKILKNELLTTPRDLFVRPQK